LNTREEDRYFDESDMDELAPRDEEFYMNQDDENNMYDEELLPEAYDFDLEQEIIDFEGLNVSQHDDDESTLETSDVNLETIIPSDSNLREEDNTLTQEENNDLNIINEIEEIQLPVNTILSDIGDTSSNNNVDIQSLLEDGPPNIPDDSQEIRAPEDPNPRLSFVNTTQINQSNRFRRSFLKPRISPFFKKNQNKFSSNLF